MAATLTIAGVQYIMIEDQFDQTNALSERQRLKCDVIDYTGTAHWQKGNQVVVTDPVLGVIFNGYLYTDKEVPQYPSGAILHSIDCIDQHYLADKRTYTRTYDTPEPAGKIVVDMLHDVLSQEGIAQNYAQHTDNTVTDFNQGILSSTIGITNIGDGNLELTPAGSNLTLTETTTADFASGLLTNCTAANNTLTPTTQQALLLKSTLAVAVAGGNYVNVQIWTGSMTVGTLDTLYSGIWCSSTSKEGVGGVELYFSDGTKLSDYGGVVDQNGLYSYGDIDLSAFAKDQWYNRVLKLPSSVNGKTITGVALNLAGKTVGDYTTYFKNMYLLSQSGSPFFSTTATVPQSTPSILSAVGYAVLPTSTTVVKVFDPTVSSRVSSAYSINTVKLLKSSTVVWYGSDTANIAVSYDGVAYQPCTNNAALPSLPAGSNLTGLTLTLKETFTAPKISTSGSSSALDPTSIPFLEQVNISIMSAPNATKSDVIKAFETQTDWNTGTYTNTTSTSGGDLTTGTFSRNWNDTLITNQTFYATNDSGTKASQSASSGAYVISINSDPYIGGTLSYDGVSRFDFAGVMVDFTMECDLLYNPDNTPDHQLDVGIFYRTNGNAYPTNGQLGQDDADYGYSVVFSGARIALFSGKNSPNSGFGLGTTIQSVTRTFSPNTFYHLKMVVAGNHHQVYVANEANPTIDAVDSTYTTPGYVGMFGHNDYNVAATVKIDNFSIIPSIAGSWVGPSTSISALGTCGPSVISWTEVNTASQSVSFAQVSTSVDGGSTFQLCTNGAAIPNLPSGTNVSGKSVITKVAFNTISQAFAPIIRQLVWRVLGQYPTVTGTRTTAPMALDTMVRANQSGLGTSTDGQTYTITGTGTPSISSNHALVVSTGSDTHASPGTRTGTDEDIYCQVNIGNTGDICGIEGRYSASSGTSAYKLLWYSGALHLNKSVNGVNTVLATSSAFVMTPGTWYVFHLRIVGINPVTLSGRAWAVGALEPTTWNITTED